MNPSDSEMLDAAMSVVNVFGQLGVPYVVGGSVASGVHGDPRATRDVDLVAALRPEHAEPLARALSGRFYADLPSIRTAICERRSFNVIHLHTMVKVDVFVAHDSFAQAQLSRRAEHEFAEGVALSVASAEDTILSKLRWYGDGGGVSDRQWNDILGVLKVQGTALDFAYLKEWAARLELIPLLERALDDAGLA